MSAGQYIQWHDLFAIVDDGAIPVDGYGPIEQAMRQHAKAYASGIGCLVILPPGANPPPEHVKRRVKELLTRLESSLTCLAYVIEGSGFKAVAARAALVGMKIFASRPYPIFVETSMHAALTQVLPHLAKGKTITSDVNVIMNAITDLRGQGIPTNSSSGAARISLSDK
jgi:hypothetical protein